MHPFNHPSVYSPTHPFAHPIHSPTYLFIYPFIHPLIHSPTHPFIHLSIHLHIHQRIHPWVGGWMGMWVAGWVSDWTEGSGMVAFGCLRRGFVEAAGLSAATVHGAHRTEITPWRWHPSPDAVVHSRHVAGLNLLLPDQLLLTLNWCYVGLVDGICRTGTRANQAHTNATDWARTSGTPLNFIRARSRFIGY